MGKKPGVLLLRQLEVRTKELSWEFNSQDIANMLWAHATMGTKPGEQLLGQLEQRTVAISREFTPLSLAGMKKWYGMMGTKPGRLVEELLDSPTHCAGKRKAREGETGS